MDLSVTLIGLAAALGLATVFGWRGAQPPNPARGPRLIPWRFLMVLSATAALVLCAHLLALTGIKSGD